tara:strand:+ start:3334 stop:4257 length:924 start_codon:yes stop_codon:yes gene_type:complete
MSASDGETNTGGNQNEELNEKISMTPETRERIEGLMHDMIEGGLWGYKNRTDPTEREVAFQSEATAEKLFANLYADDPVNAKKKWQEFSGKPADKGLIARAESLIIDKDPNKAIDSLETDQKRVLGTAKKFLNENEAKNREKQMSSLRIAMGDTEQRQRDFRRRATDQVFAQEKEADGISIAKAFIKGATRVADDFHASWRERGKGKEMSQVMKDLQGGIEVGEKSKIFQQVRGSVIEDVAKRGFTGAAAKMAMNMMAGVMSKMTGESRRNAAENAPAPIKPLLLPAPGKHFGGPDFGSDMGPGLAT